MQIITAHPGEYVYIGREGENGARQVQFDISAWVSSYGQGTVELIYQRPGEAASYPAAVEQEDNLVLWTITATDTAKPGRDGHAELQYYVGETLVKAETCCIAVGDALAEPGRIPERPGQAWLDRVMEAIDNAGGSTEQYVPDFVKAGADRVAQTILALQNEHTFTFASVADVHVNYGSSQAQQTKTSIIHAAMAIKRVAAQVGVDFMVNFGDNLWGENDNVEDAKMENLILNQAIFDTFRSHPNFRLIGNHDANLWNAVIPTTAVYAMNGRYNDFDAVGETKMRGYGYKDFRKYKLRVIGLNTSDYIDQKGGYAMSDEQKLWFMEALDLSDKEDAQQWQILILSHFPLDYPSSDYDTHKDIPAILSAYQSGGTLSISAGSYDYQGKNKALIIAGIHGHIHNFSYGAMEGHGVVRVCTPNTCFYNNGASGTDQDAGYLPAEIYDKTVGTVEDTTVTFYTVDMEKKIIYSTNYGAGYDRQIAYGTSPRVFYTVTNNLSNAVSGNNARTVLEGSVYTASLTAYSGYTLTGAEVTVIMDGVNITSSAYKNGVITIGAVTGNIVITIRAVAEETGESFSQTVDDLACAVRQAFYITDGAFDPQSDNQRIALGCSTDNGHGWTTREETVVYLIPIPDQAAKVTVETSDSNIEQMGINFVDAADGVYSKSSSSGWKDVGVYEFIGEERDAQYMVIDLKYISGVNVAWGYDVNANVKVTFSD